MNIDFSLVLVLAVLISGVVWLLDLALLAPGRRRRIAEVQAETNTALTPELKDTIAGEPVLVEYAKSFFPVLLLVLVLRSFLVEPFQIPSGSMLPTLEVGDFILVNKYHYGIRLPVLGTKVVEMEQPTRGDVMVFRFPRDPSINYIKRVVGLPGDRISYQNKRLSVNGSPLPLELQASLPVGAPRQHLYQEKLGEVEHAIYTDIGPSRPPAEWVVPPGHYFVMGDNRDNSNDSRFWGFVPDELVVGKAFAVWMHWENLLSLPSFKNNGLIN